MFRIVIGAVIFVLGVLLAQHLNELIGVVFVLLGIVIGVPRSIRPIFQILFHGLYAFLFIGLAYAMESGEFGPSFDEWLSDRWWFVVYFTTLVFGSLLLQYRDNANAWQVLKESYESDLEKVGERDRYPTVYGTLMVDAEYFDVNIVASELGIFIARDEHGHVYLPWGRLQKMVFEGSRPRRVKVHISRKLLNPLVLDLPWHEVAMDQIPTHVKVERSA